MNVLLLNPPGKLLYLRGGYCSGISKGKYYYPAIDLLVQSGFLAGESTVTVFDSITRQASTGDLMMYLQDHRPDVILAVTAHCSAKNDLDILETVNRAYPDIRIFLTGGYLLFEGKNVIQKHEFIEGILMDFTSGSLAAYLRNGTNGPPDLLLRSNTAASRENIEVNLEYPCPRHELFPLRDYNLPFSRYRPMSVIHQTFGCPFHCSFCVFSGIKLQVRNTENVIEELQVLKKIGVRELFFADPTFAARPAQTLELCKQMINANLGFSWFCQSRTDVLNDELIQYMNKAGCHTIQFGIETVQESQQVDYKKRLNINKSTSVLEICKAHNIRILGSIIIGLPGDTRETALATLDYLIQTGFDYISVNIAAPEIGTEFRQESLDRNLFSLEEENLDPTHVKPLLDNPRLSKAEQWELRNHIVKKFYLRPAYLFNRLKNIKSWTELTNLMREGFSVLSNLG